MLLFYKWLLTMMVKAYAKHGNRVLIIKFSHNYFNVICVIDIKNVMTQASRQIYTRFTFILCVFPRYKYS